MKKIFIICLVLLSLTLCVLPASAEAEFENMQALWDHWVASAADDALSFYPEGVCGVWCYGDMSRVTVMVTKNDEGIAAKEHILASLKNSDGVDFTYGAYSYLELREIQEELNKKAQSSNLGEEVGLCWWGVSEQNNRLEIGINTSNPGAAEFMQQMFDTYADRVAFEHCDGVFNYVNYVDSTVSDTPAVFDSSEQSGNMIVFTAMPGMAIPGGETASDAVATSYDGLLLVGILTAAALIGAAMIGVRRAAARTAVLSSGEAVAATDEHVKTMVSNAAVTPSAQLDERIFDAVKRTDE